MIITWYFLGLLGVAAHIISKVMRSSHQLAALATYVRGNTLVILNAVIVYTMMFAVWVGSDLLAVMGWEQGELNGTVVLLGYFSQSIMGHLSKRVKDGYNA